MFEFTETIDIEAAPDAVWEVMSDVERWWPASNPEHDGLERLDGDGGELRVGTRFKITERIAGIPGVAVGEITRFEPGSEVTWEAPDAGYRLAGIAFEVGEGVTWRIRRAGSGSEVRAHVWATFAPGVAGRLLEWTFEHVFRGIDRDREHTRTELHYLKQTIETGAPR